MENKNNSQNTDFLFARVILLLEKLAAQIGVVNTYSDSMVGSYTSQKESLKQKADMEGMKKVDNILLDLGGLKKFLRQAQIDLYDIVRALQGPKEKLDDDKTFDTKALEEADTITAQMNKFLPKRETPVLPSGNILAVSLFLASSFAKEVQLTFGLYLGKNVELLKHEMVKKMGVYLEKLESTLFLLARWSNLILEQKEFIWTPPSDKPGAPATQPAQPTQPSQPAPQTPQS